MSLSYSRRGHSWTEEEDRKLYDLTIAGRSLSHLCEEHQRSEGGIKARQTLLGLRDERSSGLVIPPPPFKSISSRNTSKPVDQNSSNIAKVGSNTSSSVEVLQEPGTFSAAATNSDFDWVDQIWGALERDIAELSSKKGLETSDRSAHIWMARLSPGNDYHELVTLQDLGDAYGISRERIRQISVKGERILKTRIRSRKGWTYPILCQFQSIYESAEGAQLFKDLIHILVESDVTQQFGHFVISTVGRLRSLPTRDIARYEIAFRDVSAEKAKQGRSAASQARLSERRRRRADNFVNSILKKSTFSGQFAVEGVQLRTMPRLRSCSRERSLYSTTLGRAVQWESYGERRFIQALDQSSIISEFAEQPVEIDFVYQGRNRKYFVDLLVKTVDDLIIAVEIKSPVMLA